MLLVGLLEEEAAVGDRGDDEAEAGDDEGRQEEQHIRWARHRRDGEERQASCEDDRADQDRSALRDPAGAPHPPDHQGRDDSRQQEGHLHEGERQSLEVVGVLEEVAEGQQQDAVAEVEDKTHQDRRDEDGLAEEANGEDTVLALLAHPQREEPEDRRAGEHGDHGQRRGEAVGGMRDAIEEDDDADREEQLSGEVPGPLMRRARAVLGQEREDEHDAHEAERGHDDVGQPPVHAHER